MVFYAFTFMVVLWLFAYDFKTDWSIIFSFILSAPRYVLSILLLKVDISFPLFFTKFSREVIVELVLIGGGGATGSGGTIC